MDRFPLRRWWPVVKPLCGLAIVLFVGWHLVRQLRDPAARDVALAIRWPWLATSVALYLVGLSCWGAFWGYLLHIAQPGPPVYATARAYFIGHLGKYVPGKAWAVLLRVSFLRRVGYRPAITVTTATYETLCTMAAGACVAAVLAPWALAGSASLWQALGLLALAGFPILPGVFNRLADRVARPFRGADATPLPVIPARALLLGMVVSGIGWLWLGLSLTALLQAILPQPLPLSPHLIAACVAANAVSYVAGFLALPAPGGLGIREAMLAALVAPWLATSYDAPEAAKLAAAVAVLLRLTWTLSEVVLAALLYSIPPAPREGPA